MDLHVQGMDLHVQGMGLHVLPHTTPSPPPLVNPQSWVCMQLRDWGDTLYVPVRMNSEGEGGGPDMQFFLWYLSEDPTSLKLLWVLKKHRSTTKNQYQFKSIKIH